MGNLDFTSSHSSNISSSAISARSAGGAADSAAKGWSHVDRMIDGSTRWYWCARRSRNLQMSVQDRIKEKTGVIRTICFVEFEFRGEDAPDCVLDVIDSFRSRPTHRNTASWRAVEATDGVMASEAATSTFTPISREISPPRWASGSSPRDRCLRRPGLPYGLDLSHTSFRTYLVVTSPRSELSDPCHSPLPNSAGCEHGRQSLSIGMTCSRSS